MTDSARNAPAWLEAFAPYADRPGYRVPLKAPIHLLGGRIVGDVAGVSLRLPRWEGPAFVDDFGKKAAGMVELDGEHLFAELAVLRLLERDGWSGRWVNTYSGKGEVWKYLTHWSDVPRAEQRSRPIEDAEPRQLLARIASRGKARYRGCWDLFAWRDGEFAFVQTKRSATPEKEVVKPEQAAWLHTALVFADTELALDSFAVVHWDYA